MEVGLEFTFKSGFHNHNDRVTVAPSLPLYEKQALCFKDLAAVMASG